MKNRNKNKSKNSIQTDFVAVQAAAEKVYDEDCLAQIGANIRFLRSACQISQMELARRIGVSQTHLSNVERNHAGVNLRLLLSLANAFGCPLETFLDAGAARNWGKEQAEKTASEQEEITETYTVEEVRQLLQLVRLSHR